MKLSPGERSVLASFPSSNAGQKAEEELKKSGFDHVQLDRISRYGVTTNESYNNPINRARTVTGPTLYSNSQGVTSQDIRILMGADPSASGYGDTNYGIAGGRAFLLTVVAAEDKIKKAEEIIKKHGGSF
ncbi:hypothetical protein DCCM_2064 [Desulfocucumis palustris]|uniref:Uncharacterized protein n=1 Tax=Desulfocucumis palustris TaxID=1898651 RepID=A0A2L2X9M6_9FIRM|nr:hypothetical protein [Desulfocucumis palustris]GBF32967.1 hypothetical protein DCCM_2064 [Desulfocucumis palustris]